jgi:Fumarylacetoacetate (FAA) hydrolase family
VSWPYYAQLLDFELELACVIGKPGVDIAQEEAAEYVFGYTIFNDVSARDAQATEMEGQLDPAKGKDFDTGNVLGPWLVTADEIGDPYDLTMVARATGSSRRPDDSRGAVDQGRSRGWRRGIGLPATRRRVGPLQRQVDHQRRRLPRRGRDLIVRAGPVTNWIAACDRLLALDGIETVVPGQARSPTSGPSPPSRTTSSRSDPGVWSRG